MEGAVQLLAFVQIMTSSLSSIPILVAQMYNYGKCQTIKVSSFIVLVSFIDFTDCSSLKKTRQYNFMSFMQK